MNMDDIEKADRMQAKEPPRDYRDSVDEAVRQRTAVLQSENAILLARNVRQEVLINKLEEAHNQLLLSEKVASIDQLLAGLAHEINNPVGFVHSNLGTLRRYAKDLLRLLAAYEQLEGSVADGLLQEIRSLKLEIDATYLYDDIGNLLTESIEGLLRVKRIVRDLNDFACAGESAHLLGNLEKCVESSLDAVRNEIKDKAEVVTEFGDIPANECYPSQLNQVFVNLLSNAAQAIDARGLITIRTGHSVDNFWVEVEDSGRGIAPEHLERIFEPFYTTKPAGQGSGLGLSVSFWIVHKYGGRIEATSELGRGSTFRVVLPRNSDANDHTYSRGM